jgi:hypothetical protein
MASCEAAWREGEILAVAEAAEWSRQFRQPIPAWLADAVVEFAVKRRSPAQAKRHRAAQTDLARYMLVRDLKVGIPGVYEPTADLTWEKAYAEASRMLDGTLAKGSEDTMKRAYEDVKNDLKAGHSGKYFMLKDWRYRLNGKPDEAEMPKPPFGPHTTGVMRK